MPLSFLLPLAAGKKKPHHLSISAQPCGRGSGFATAGAGGGAGKKSGRRAPQVPPQPTNAREAGDGSEEHRVRIATELHRQPLSASAELVVLGVSDGQLEQAAEDEAAYVVGEVHAERDDPERCA